MPETVAKQGFAGHYSSPGVYPHRHFEHGNLLEDRRRNDSLRGHIYACQREKNKRMDFLSTSLYR